MTRWTDTSPEAEQMLRDVLGRMPLERRRQQLGAIYRTTSLLARVRKDGAGEMTTGKEQLQVVQEIIAILDDLGIAYALGGSWACSLLGKMRFTHHADLAAEPFPGREADFCSRFGPDYYISLPAVQDAVRQRGSFNIIHTLSGFKVDVFIRKDRPFEQSLMGRRFAFTLPDSNGQTIQCVSPEDLILLKLEWYRLGGESSQQQLLDVRGVLEVQADRLDQAYLDRWASNLGIKDLLDSLRKESAL